MPSVAEIIVYIMYKIKIVQFINQCALPGLPEWPFCGQIMVIKWPFEAIGCSTLLWPKDTTFSKTHKGYSGSQNIDQSYIGPNLLAVCGQNCFIPKEFKYLGLVLNYFYTPLIQQVDQNHYILQTFKML